MSRYIGPGSIVKVIYLPTYMSHFHEFGEIGVVSEINPDDDKSFMITFLDGHTAGWWESTNVEILEDNSNWKEKVKGFYERS